MPDHHYKFSVAMSCTGCSKAVEKGPKKTQRSVTNSPHTISPIVARLSHPKPTLRSAAAGVKECTVWLENQAADVTAADKLDYDTVLATIKKTGKTVMAGEADGEIRPI